MLKWTAKNLMTHDTHDAKGAVALISAVRIVMGERHISRIFPSNRTLLAHIHKSPQIIQYDLQSNVIHIMNTDTFMFGSYYYLEQLVIQRYRI
jgi:hypothetical protein